jgi:hypothetical protein
MALLTLIGQLKKLSAHRAARGNRANPQTGSWKMKTGDESTIILPDRRAAPARNDPDAARRRKASLPLEEAFRAALCVGGFDGNEYRPPCIPFAFFAPILARY